MQVSKQKVMGLFAMGSFLLGVPASAKRVTVMSYNVENLFDNVHDKGKTDYTYLPKSTKDRLPEVYEFCRKETNKFYREECYDIDWTDDKLQRKFGSLTKVVASVNQGDGPDIIALQEVENINVLNLWMQHSLGALGYQEVVLIEGNDPRGIDGAIISKYPLVSEPLYHQTPVRLSWADVKNVFEPEILKVAAKPVKRGILEATFKIAGGQELVVMSNHWPSQGNSSTDREQMAKILHVAAQKIAKSGRPLVSMGDYNTLDSDKPHGVNDWLLNNRRAVSFHDARAEYVKANGGYKAGELPGSHWYQGEYSALDKILVLKNSSTEAAPDWSSFRTVAEPFMLIEANQGSHKYRPMRFSFKTGSGYTDHLPITLDLDL